MITDDLVQYYSDLLISQYEDQANAVATVKAFVAEIVADQIVAKVRDGFNFTTVPGGLSDTAEGVQLEDVASYRGVTRQIYGLNITRKYFLMPTYGDVLAPTDPGFARYGSPVTWFFRTFADNTQPIYEMNDTELVRVAQVRALAQSNLLSVSEVDDILFAFFGANAAVFESGAMTITYLFLLNDPDSLSTVLYQTKSLPRPAGVALNVIHSSSISGIFGFQFYNQVMNNAFIGFGLYGAAKAASWLIYGG
jgi:hypothetical protein